MPEASVDEDRLPRAPRYDVGLPRKILGMETVVMTGGVENAAHDHFRARIAPLYPRHSSAAIGLAECIHHRNR